MNYFLMTELAKIIEEAKHIADLHIADDDEDIVHLEEVKVDSLGFSMNGGDVFAVVDDPAKVYVDPPTYTIAGHGANVTGTAALHHHLFEPHGMPIDMGRVAEKLEISMVDLYLIDQPLQLHNKDGVIDGIDYRTTNYAIEYKDAYGRSHVLLYERGDVTPLMAASFLLLLVARTISAHAHGNSVTQHDIRATWVDAIMAHDMTAVPHRLPVA